MLSSEFKEKCRDIGLLAEYIVCMADSWEEPPEKFRSSIFYKEEFEDKQNIILEMIDTADRIINEVGMLPLCNLQALYKEYGIALTEYADMLRDALRTEPYSNNEVKFKCDAILSIVIDMLYREIRADAAYKRLAAGEVSENVQVQLLS